MERTAEEWGRIAVSLPGWRWMPGMRNVIPPRNDGGPGFASRILDAELTGPPPLTGLPDPDDPATGGCLLALAGAPHRLLPTVEAWLSGAPVEGITSLGRAVIVDVRDQWGRWPGGEE